MRHRFFLIGLFLFLVACASGPRTGSSRQRNLITIEEIAEIDALDALRVIETLRPQWLRSRGPTGLDDPTPMYPSVYVDGSFMGDLNFLRSIHVRDILEIRFWDPGEAAVRYGMGHPRGIIEVTFARE